MSVQLRQASSRHDAIPEMALQCHAGQVSFLTKQLEQDLRDARLKMTAVRAR